MGFAVVADEVRSLAQRSSEAARETAGLIEESITRSREGRTHLEDLFGTMRKVTDAFKEIASLVEQVNTGSADQARGIQEITRAITQMEHTAQSTATGAEQAAGVGQELSAQAEAMRSTVARLHAMVE